MRVLMLSWEYPPKSVGGLARHVEDLSTSLAAEGHHVHVITCGTQGVPAYQVHHGVHIHRVEPYAVNAIDFLTWILQLNLRMLEYAMVLMQENAGFDLVHCHDWLVAFAGRALKHAYQLPLVATIHATEAGRNQGLHNDMQRYISSVEWWLTYEAWRVIVCSEHMRHEVRGVFQIPPDKVAIIPNGVKPEKFRSAQPPPHFRERFAQPWEQIVFFVGRLVREKGVHVLLDAAPQVLASSPDAKFVVAGTGPMEGQLKHQARTLGIADKVCFTGYIDDHTRNHLYRNAKVAVFPSLYEPFGIVALEGMAAGTPVVVSDTGGLNEIVTHGVTGLKAYTGDSASLAGNISAVLRDASFAEQLKQNATRLVEEVYDWRQIARRTAQVYLAVYSEYRRSPWQMGRNPIQRVRRYAQSLVGNRGGGIQEGGIQEMPVHHSRYSLIEHRVNAVHYHREGREGP